MDERIRKKMKTYKHLYEEFISEENIKLAIQNEIKKKRHRPLFNKIYNIANVEMNDIDGSLRVSVQQQKMCNTPRIIGSSVLHYSKKLLYDFWYNYIVGIGMGQSYNIDKL